MDREIAQIQCIPGPLQARDIAGMVLFLAAMMPAAALPRNSLSMPDGPDANLSRGRDLEIAQSTAAVGT